MMDFIERLKTKPEHVRRRIAVGTTAALTAVVAVGWGALTVSSGALALAPTNVDLPNGAQMKQAYGQSQSAFSALANAASAFTGATTAPATLTIVDGGSSSTLDERASTTPDRTVIPF